MNTDWRAPSARHSCRKSSNKCFKLRQERHGVRPESLAVRKDRVQTPGAGVKILTQRREGAKASDLGRKMVKFSQLGMVLEQKRQKSWFLPYLMF
jgi:hypothetical protein